MSEVECDDPERTAKWLRKAAAYHKPSKPLKSARAAAGWTQQQLADRLGVIRVTVARWDSGASSPSAGAREAMRELADKLEGQ